MTASAASTQALFRPFTHKGLSLPNRVVMAPMTRVMSPGGVPDAAVAGYYARRAQGGVGLILTEGTVVERPASKNEANIPNFYGEALDGWAEVVKAVHAEGGQIAPQIWHTGSVPGRDTTYRPQPVDSPSGLGRDGTAGKYPPMSEADIADTIDAFGRAAGSAKALGFDALELHGAHGYLIDQFFWGQTNRRTDAWGGQTLGERTRFAVEVLKAARAAVGPDFPILIRLSQWKGADYTARMALTPAEMESWLAPLADAGADIFHCSQRRFWEPEFEGSDLNFAGWARKLTGKPTITVGSVGLTDEFISSFSGQGAGVASLDALLARLEADEFDLVAVGRALLSDPEWLAKIRDGRHEALMPFDAADMMVLT